MGTALRAFANPALADLWYNETALEILGAAVTAEVLGAIGRNAVRRANDKGGSR